MSLTLNEIFSYAEFLLEDTGFSSDPDAAIAAAEAWTDKALADHDTPEGGDE